MAAEVPPTQAQRAAHESVAAPEPVEAVEAAETTEAELADASTGSVELSERTYLGVVKSYNDRRGFGFVACAEIVAQHGRDVYLPKVEAALAAAADPAAEKMAEDDVLQFRVRLSVEGYPQAAQVKRLPKFRGTVASAPRPAGDGAPAAAGLLRSREMAEALGRESAAVDAESVGQLRLVEGDEVSFCVPCACDGGLPEAQLVCLERTQRSAASALGLFSASLPRDGRRPDLTLQCHAFLDKVVVTGLPADVTEAELFHFFSKQGATKVALARSAGGAGYAAAQFPGIGAVSRLLGSKVHAFADETETRFATLAPGAALADQPPLPALPRPLLVAGREPGTLLITWSPSTIAAEYTLEIRPSGVRAPWRAIDDFTGHVQRPECSSCRVTGLPTSTALEVRVSFATTCGTRSEASDASEPCVAVPPPAAQAAQPEEAGPPAALPPQVVHAMAQAMHAGAAQAMHAGAVPAVAAPAVQPYAPGAGWQCVHGGLVPAPPVPEVRWADDAGSSVLVQWPSVAHAAAYVVELYEAGSSASERFIRAAGASAPGCPVDLQIGGLRPLAPGCCYTAQIRCVSSCGCESAPSAPGWTLAKGSAPSAAVLPRLLRSPGQQAEVAKMEPVPMVTVPFGPQDMHAGAVAGGGVFGGGFQAAGGVIMQGVPMGVPAGFLMLD